MCKYQRVLIGIIAALCIGCGQKADDALSGKVSEHGLSLQENTASVNSKSKTSGEKLVGQWPRWLGPAGDGLSRETGWSQDWTTAVPKKVWSFNVGTGFSSMVVVDGRLYTMGHRDGKEFVYCLNARSGEEIWDHGYPGKLLDKQHEGGPGATPTVDDGLVFTLGREGQLHCVRADNGKLVWSKLLQKELEVGLPEWGFSCSPLVLGDIVIVDAGRTVAFNKKTGKKIWQTAKYASGYGSPHAFQRASEFLIAVLNNDFLLILRAEDGTEVARKPWKTPYKTNATTPIVRDGHVFLSTGYNKGCALLRFDGKTLEFVYHNKDMRNHFNNSILFDGHLYGIDGQTSSSRNCRVVCMDWATGEVKWKQRGLGCGSLLIADGKLLILSDQGKLVMAQATPEQYSELGSVEALTGKCWTVPVLAGGRIYCRNAVGDLVCLDVRG